MKSPKSLKKKSKIPCKPSSSEVLKEMMDFMVEIAQETAGSDLEPDALWMWGRMFWKLKRLYDKEKSSL